MSFPDREARAAMARAIFDAGVAAADPGRGVTDELTARPAPDGQPLICVGKAATRMAKAALATGLKPSQTIIVTNPENAQEVEGAQVFAAAHPVPDAVGEDAGRAVIAAVEAATDGVLCLISGGGSALLPAPVEGVTLDDKAQVNAMLLASGAEITEMNCVRQALSRLKGGGLVRLAAPAKVRALILSDVVGDDLRAIASGPTVAPLGPRSQAREIVRERGLWDALPASVQTALSRPDDAPPPEADNTLIGSNTQSVMAMMTKVREVADGLPVFLHSPALEGDVADAATRVAGCTDRGIHLFGGETTVTLVGSGRGGRNQDLALRVALMLSDKRGDYTYLQGGTDGRDGPTDAAGGVVDEATLATLADRGVDAAARLLDNDAYPALKAADALLMTGGTGTNVADLGVFIRA
ncbi:MAG: DUF4147 domain-containing protein [Pseudomonadota bacterium]